MAGYSPTPLLKKLGIKAGFNMVVWHEPVSYWEDLGILPEGIERPLHSTIESVDFIHLFAQEKAILERDAPLLKTWLKKDGLMWVSWPKGASKLETDLKREPVRDYMLDLGLVDVKVAAVDADWSGLKFVYRLKDR